jgi:hypothetical protein
MRAKSRIYSKKFLLRRDLIMSMNFGDLVEKIKKLSSEEKEELRFLIERFLIEERREEIHKHYKESIEEFEKGELEFSSDINKLKEILE